MWSQSRTEADSYVCGLSLGPRLLWVWSQSRTEAAVHVVSV